MGKLKKKIALKGCTKVLTSIALSTAIALSFTGCISNKTKSVEEKPENTQIIITSVDDKFGTYTNEDAKFSGDTFADFDLIINSTRLTVDSKDIVTTWGKDHDFKTDISTREIIFENFYGSHFGEVSGKIVPENNCLDFLCVVNYNYSNLDEEMNIQKEMIKEFDSFIEKNSNSEKFKFQDVTNAHFIWKTNCLKDPCIIYYDNTKNIPEYYNNEFYQDYINKTSGIIGEASFKLFETNSSKVYLIRYNCNTNTYAIRDISVYATISSAESSKYMTFTDEDQQYYDLYGYESTNSTLFEYNDYQPDNTHILTLK